MPIGRVVELLRREHPSVTPSSLRFLEREGLIQPTRTPGGHRLYSDDDVRRILQIKTWQAKRLSLEEIHARLRQREALPDPAAIASAFLAQVLAGDVAAATTTMLGADDLGMPLSQLFAEVLEPALVEIGRGWEHGTVLVAQEKVVSELARDLIAELSMRHAAPDPHGPAVVAACVAGERHELGLRMLTGLLRSEGYRVHYLGADVDAGFLADAVRLHATDAVALSARFDTSMPALEEAITTVRAAARPGASPLIVAGGQIVAEQADDLTALGAVPITSGNVADAMEAFADTLRHNQADGH